MYRNFLNIVPVGRGEFAKWARPAKKDALHLACAIFAKADYFLTTDDKVIKKTCALTDIKIIDPIDFIKKVFP